MEDAPPYAALGYTWGSPPSREHPLRRLKINGTSLGVWKSCDDTLRQIRENFTHVLALGLNHVWIDSVCINQEDLVEKAAQVEIMGSEIYPRADWVFVCLGLESDGSEDLLANLIQVDEEGVEPQVRDELMSGHEHACIELGHRPYRKRLWVLPGILTAKQIQVFCESHVIHWRLIKELLDRAPPSMQRTALWKVCET